MEPTSGASRALWVFSALGVATIVATVGLVLGFERRIVAQHRKLALAASVRHAEQCAELLRGGELLGRLRALVARNPQIASLVEIAPQIRAELADIGEVRKGQHEFHVLVVDENLQPVWPPVGEEDRDLRPCSRHILEGEERVYVLPHGCANQGDPPDCLCFTAPLQRDGKLLGGLVVHRQLASPEHAFSALDRKMTWVLVVSQAVLLVALGAIAYSARRAIASAEQRRAKGERLAALGNLAAGVAHEIRNPLNTIALTCRYLERLIAQGATDPALRSEAHTNFEVVASELARLTRTLDDFVVLARPTDLEVRDCDLEAVLNHTLALFARELEQAKVALQREGGGPLPVRGDPDRLGQVLSNIIRNAVQAMPDGGTLSVRSHREDGRAIVAFADTGPGIPRADLHRIFEPYFTTKRSGLGLGLALSLRIVEAHGGSLSVANQPGSGALVTVSVPLKPSEANHAA